MNIYGALQFWLAFFLGGITFILIFVKTRKRFNMVAKRKQTEVKREPLTPDKYKYATLKNLDTGHIQKIATHRLPLKEEEPIFIQPMLVKICAVPYYDYELIKHIRTNMAMGITTVHAPPEDTALVALPDGLYNEGQVDNKADELHCINGEVLHKYYGLSCEEVFELTGYVIGTADIKEF